MSHEIMLCEDGVTRAVEVVKGTLIDPSLGSLKKAREEAVKAVSYTHLTLPTICSV